MIGIAKHYMEIRFFVQPNPLYPAIFLNKAIFKFRLQTLQFKLKNITENIINLTDKILFIKVLFFVYICDILKIIHKLMLLSLGDYD